MRLLILVNDFPDKRNEYIANIFVKEQVKALAKYVEKINVVVPIPIGIELKRKTSYEDYTMGENVHVYFVKYVNPVLPVVHKNPKFENLWVKYETSAVKRFIEKHKIEFDIIHAHYTWHAGAVGAKLKNILKVPLVLTEHAHVSLYPRIKNKDPLLYYTWKNVDVLIRVNKKDIAMFRRYFPSLKITHVPNGYDKDRMKTISTEIARKKLGLSMDKKILFNLARLYPYKGHKYLIYAMSEVVKRRHDVMCFIGGDGPMRSKLLKKIERLNLEKFIKILGYVPDNQLKYWMNSADLFVLPSLSEGNPTVMFEALGVGLPFVGTAVGGVPEIITSEDYGLLCPPKDSKCLAEKILIALEKDWDREKIREYAQQFAWENIAKQIIGVYEKVLDDDHKNA